jgi:hypothetical protein
MDLGEQITTTVWSFLGGLSERQGAVVLDTRVSSSALKRHQLKRPRATWDSIRRQPTPDDRKIDRRNNTAA